MKLIRLPLAALALALGFALVTATSYAADEAAMHADLQKIADEIAAGKDVSKAAEAFAKKYPIDESMTIFKPRNPSAKVSGIGVGKPGDYTPDGIESVWLSLGKKQMAPGDLKAKKGDLVKAAEHTAAMVEVAKFYAPKKAADAKKWEKYNDEAKKASKELIEGLKSEDPAKVKTAMNKVTGACNDCHSEFRK